MGRERIGKIGWMVWRWDMDTLLLQGEWMGLGIGGKEYADGRGEPEVGMKVIKKE